MSRTIGKRWPRSLPGGDCAAICQICGVRWPHSKLRKDADGLLVCPDEGTGKTATELNDANIADGRSRNRTRPTNAQLDVNEDDSTPPQRTTIDDIEV